VVYEVYTQMVFRGDPAPPGEGWEPFAAHISVEHNGLRESLGGGLEEYGEVVWWRRAVRCTPPEVDRG
jgi:hypothetical protein